MPWSTKYVTDWLSYVYNPLYNPLKFNVDLTWLNYIYNDHASLIIIFIMSPFSTASPVLIAVPTMLPQVHIQPTGSGYVLIVFMDFTGRQLLPEVIDYGIFEHLSVLMALHRDGL